MRELHAWAAGFIDGEGYFGLHRFRRPNGVYRYQPRVVVGQNVRYPLDRLQTLYGGSVRVRSTGHWAWEVRGVATLVVIDSTYEWLTVKRPAASIVREFITESDSRVGVKLSQAEQDRRTNLYKRLLNLRHVSSSQ